MAMQSGEIDCYTSVSAAAKEIYAGDPSSYVLTVIPATRLQFYVLNMNRLSENVRKAINLTTDCEGIAAYLGTVSAAVGPFGASAPYGQVTKPAPDPAAAKALLEATDMSVREIAERLAFNTVNYFIQSFRDTVGCTPAQYRKKYRTA